MRFANPSVKVITALVLLVWLVPGAGAQAQQPSKGKAAAKPSKAPEKPKATPGAGAVRAAVERPASRRDPFEPLVAKERPGGGIPEHLPPGKPGLVVGTLRVDGIVRAPSGMIAVVTTPQQRVYFLREGDRLYNGSVERITMEAVSFHEIGKDAFGKPLERQVVKRLYPSAGEQ